jgi:3-hydroxybutyryl-CoA dehydrogenase
MGRGIAVAFAYAGHRVVLLDVKERAADGFRALSEAALGEVSATFASLAALGMFDAAAVDMLAARVKLVPAAERGRALGEAEIIFEGVPEILELKREVLAEASRVARPDAIIASTTSTIMVNDIAGSVERPERFLNAHWLNPAYLVPLVEVSPGERTDPDIVQRLKALLEAIGKVPVVCKSSPGFIVPRVQALAMNEAARMVEEGVASAEEIDTAIRVGFGFRFAVLGLLEFIDWGGGDILFHASRYLEGALGNERYRAPEVIGRNMEEGRIGLRTGQGFLDYEGLDVEAYRRERLAAFIGLLKHLGLSKAPELGPM